MCKVGESRATGVVNFMRQHPQKPASPVAYRISSHGSQRGAALGSQTGGLARAGKALARKRRAGRGPLAYGRPRIGV